MIVLPSERSQYHTAIVDDKDFITADTAPPWDDTARARSARLHDAHGGAPRFETTKPLITKPLKGIRARFTLHLARVNVIKLRRRNMYI